MPAKPSPWHADLESSLALVDIGLPEDYDLSWQPLPPFDDWIIHVSKDGHQLAVIVTAHQLTLSENLISLVIENASGRLIRVIATPARREYDASLNEIMESSSIHLLRY